MQHTSQLTLNHNACLNLRGTQRVRKLNLSNVKVEKLKKFCHTLAHRLQIQFEDRYGPRYMPKSISVKGLDTLVNQVERGEVFLYFNLLHELCHYLVASQEQRQQLNFGLGYDEGSQLTADNNSQVEDELIRQLNDEEMSSKESFIKEGQATLLNVIFADSFGFVAEEVLSYFNYFEGATETQKYLEKDLAFLKEEKIIDERFSIN